MQLRTKTEIEIYVVNAERNNIGNSKQSKWSPCDALVGCHFTESVSNKKPLGEAKLHSHYKYDAWSNLVSEIGDLCLLNPSGHWMVPTAVAKIKENMLNNDRSKGVSGFCFTDCRH